MLITELSLDLFRQSFSRRHQVHRPDEASGPCFPVCSRINIESMYRTICKTNGSVTIITQVCITEIAAAKSGRPSSTTRPPRYPAAYQPGFASSVFSLGLTGHEMDLIKSVRSDGCWVRNLHQAGR
jgi:hypothetical protein